MQISDDQVQLIYGVMRQARLCLVTRDQMSPDDLKTYDEQLAFLRVVIGQDVSNEDAQGLLDEMYLHDDLTGQHYRGPITTPQPSLWKRIKDRVRGWPTGGKHHE